ncbi:MAG: hypothetical protein HZA32_20720 [Opitutae bacterium]|nr:hypothetical protein [Opitutae bacterium]
MSTRTLAAAALALSLLGSVTAQTPAAAPAADKPAATVAGAQPTQASVSRDKDTLSVDFPEEDVKTILRNVADLFELNIVVPDTLVGKTSIKLRDVTWRQIFDTVLSPVGYTYIEEGNIIKIVSRESLTQEPATTEVFILNNAKAADIKPTVDGLVDAAQGGKILIDVRSNALVVTTQPSRMTRIRAIIEKLDKATDQVMIESKFVEVSDSDIRNIGVNWASLQGVQLSAGKLSQTWSKGASQTGTNGSNTNNGTNLTNTTGHQNVVGDQHGTTNSNTATANTQTGFSTSLPTGTSGAASSVSFPSGSVSLTNPNATISTVTGPPTIQTTDAQGNPMTQALPISTTNSTTVAVDGLSHTTSTNDTLTTGATNTVTSVVNNLLGLTNSNTQSRLASAVFTASDFNIIVSALKQQNNTKVISNPTIVTLNNTEAFINIGSEYPIPSYTYNSERGTFEVSGFQYKPIGVILKVTPQVNAQGVIRMTLEPEISSSNRETTFGGAGGASIPIIDTRKVKTQVSLKDGYTAGIGGLMSASKAHGGTKVPVLGSIPVLGRLFSSKSVNDVTTNLLIFITAKTVSADGADPSQVFNAAALEAAGETPAAKTTK